MQYICICMSPAIDANVALDKPPRGGGEIFKNVKVEENVGGKAINVARWLAIRCCTPVSARPVIACAGLLGEDNAEPFVKEFAKYGITDKMTRVQGSTRRNEMITWPGGSFKLNQAAFQDVAFDETEFFGQLGSMEQLGDETVAVISGSLPKCCGSDFYAKAVATLKEKGAFVVLDASGESMRLALDGHPDLIKPNAEECEALVGFVPESPDDFKRATALLQKKVGHVVISDGAAGAWFDGEFIPAPKVSCVDTTSAGDTLLAELCYQVFSATVAKGLDPLSKGIPTPNDSDDSVERTPFSALRLSHFLGAARFAVAAGSAAVEMPGSNPPSVERVEELCC